MIWVGYFFFGTIAIVALLLNVPFPFSVPPRLQNFFGSGYGELIFLSVWFVLLCSIFVLVVTALIDRLSKGRWNVSILKLAGFVSCETLFLILWFVISPSIFVPPFEHIYLVNRDRAPNEFSNPYLRYKTIDCRDISKEYGIVFISTGISIETDYLSYAPERTDKTIGWIPGRKFGDDWYWDNTGSQWDRDLFNCVNRNKAPGE